MDRHCSLYCFGFVFFSAFFISFRLFLNHSFYALRLPCILYQVSVCLRGLMYAAQCPYKFGAQIILPAFGSIQCDSHFAEYTVDRVVKSAATWFSFAIYFSVYWKKLNLKALLQSLHPRNLIHSPFLIQTAPTYRKGSNEFRSVVFTLSTMFICLLLSRFVCLRKCQ